MVLRSDGSQRFDIDLRGERVIEVHGRRRGTLVVVAER
jgi:hypothetical protein